MQTQVGIIMGSQSDLPVMEKAAEVLGISLATLYRKLAEVEETA